METEIFDFIIIGSGLGGLECGTILSKEGYRVLILEKNKQLGGNLQIFSRNKRIFDTGIHYIGGLAKGQNLYTYFDYLGIMDKLKLQRMSENGFDVITFENDPVEYRHAQGYENFIETLCENFPQERQGIVTYCDTIKTVCSHFPMYHVKPRQNNVGEVPYLDVNARDFIASCTDNEKLRNVLAGSNVLYAGEGDKTPLYVHALVVNSYIESSWKCINGGSQIANLLAKEIRQRNGVLLKNARAVDFHFNGPTIESVQLEDGRVFQGKTFISNIHPSQTLEMIEEGKIRKAYRKRVKSLENSVSVFVLYLALKPEKIPLFNCNYYHFIDPDVWACADYDENWPKGYALFYGNSGRNEKYADSMIVMSYMRFEEMAPWDETHNTVASQSERGEDYETFKEKKAQRLFSELDKKFPGIRDHTEAFYTSTPLTYRDYIGTSDGSLYGIKKDYKNPLKSFISPKTKVPNLLLTGQNLNMHGVLGVTISAIATCSEILGHQYLMNKVIENMTE